MTRRNSRKVDLWDMRNDDFFATGDDRMFGRLFKAGIAVWILGAIVSIAFWGAVIFAAVHFIGKYW